MPRLVRRASLLDRLKAHLDPYDFLLWLWEELNDDAYDEWLRLWATPIGVGLNIVFVVARGAARQYASAGQDDVFGDDQNRGAGWIGWLAAGIVHSLTALCVLNAYYTFSRKRHYRLFEQSVDVAPPTPSAHRVRLDHEPVSSSPLRYLQRALASSSAAARAHADPEREVWELRVWDPTPLSLTLFTLFSPGHVLLYYTLLPPAPLDPRPSLTVVKALFFAALLSLQLSMLRTSFSQQAKDSSLVQSRVLHEYDTKFVRPALQREVRDVGVQTRESARSPRGYRTREVDVYVPTTIVKRAFVTNPNPNYARHYDPDHLLPEEPVRRSSRGASPAVTPIVPPSSSLAPQSGYSTYTSTGTGADYSSPLKPHHERIRERTPLGQRDGGSTSGGASPLQRAAVAGRRSLAPGSSSFARADMSGGGRRRETGRF